MRAADLERLAALAPGERAWFWLCVSAQPPLLARAVRDDAGLLQLRADILDARCPPGALQSLGVAQRHRDGRLVFSAPGLSPAHRDLLAPALPGVVVVDVGPDQAVREVHRDPQPPRLPTPTAAVLAEGAWLWLGECCLWTRAEVDPDGRALAEAAAGAGEGISGFADADAKGALRLSVSCAPWTVLPVLPEALARAWVAQVDGERVVRMLRAGGLEAVLAGEPGWFWFTDADRGGTPLLVVDTERDAVRRAASASRGGGRRLSGRVAVEAQGLCFVVAKAPSGFLDAIRALPISLPPITARRG